MTRYARIYDGAVAEVIDTDKALSDLYHADIAAAFVAVDDAVIAGMIRADDGTFSQPPAAALVAVAAALAARVDADAEAIRAQYITPGAGQAMAYMAKAQQAADYLAASEPDDDDYPLLVAEVGITGDTVAEVATAVNTAYQAWIIIGAQIEAIRLRAKADINAAGTAGAAQAVYDAIEWPVAPQ